MIKYNMFTSIWQEHFPSCTICRLHRTLSIQIGCLNIGNCFICLFIAYQSIQYIREPPIQYKWQDHQSIQIERTSKSIQTFYGIKVQLESRPLVRFIRDKFHKEAVLWRYYLAWLVAAAVDAKERLDWEKPVVHLHNTKFGGYNGVKRHRTTQHGP